jgi:hypothetical protein
MRKQKPVRKKQRVLRKEKRAARQKPARVRPFTQKAPRLRRARPAPDLQTKDNARETNELDAIVRADPRAENTAPQEEPRAYEDRRRAYRERASEDAPERKYAHEKSREEQAYREKGKEVRQDVIGSPAYQKKENLQEKVRVIEKSGVAYAQNKEGPRESRAYNAQEYAREQTAGQGRMHYESARSTGTINEHISSLSVDGHKHRHVGDFAAQQAPVKSADTAHLLAEAKNEQYCPSHGYACRGHHHGHKEAAHAAHDHHAHGNHAHKQDISPVAKSGYSCCPGHYAKNDTPRAKVKM